MELSKWKEDKYWADDRCAVRQRWNQDVGRNECLTESWADQALNA